MTQASLRVELPAGSVLHLQTAEEKDLWDRSLEKYRADYMLLKQNDLYNLGALLQQQILLFRAQTAINGMIPELNDLDVPTGRYRRIELEPGEVLSYQKTMIEASKEMRALERALGIDKPTREAGGAHTVEFYVRTLKRAAHERGIHISKRTVAYEKVFNELRWKLRMLYHGDGEDRSYHNLTPKAVLDWLVQECATLEQVDKDFAREKGKLFVGKL